VGLLPVILFRIKRAFARLRHDPRPLMRAVSADYRSIGKTNRDRVARAFALVVGLQRMTQAVYFCSYVRGTLGPGFFRPQFLDYLVCFQTDLDVDVLVQDLKQLAELALPGESLAVQDPVDLVSYGEGIHGFSDPPGTVVTRRCVDEVG
jgi:hypothetical protein